MDLRTFHNYVRILMSLDRHELVGADVLDKEDEAGWIRFRDDPVRSFLRLGGKQLDAAWKLMQARAGA